MSVEPRIDCPIGVSATKRGDTSGRSHNLGCTRLLTRSVALTLAFIVCVGPGTVGKAGALQLGTIQTPVAALNPAKFDPLLLPRAWLSSGQSLIIATAFDAASANTLAALIQQSGGVVTRRLS